MVLLAAEVGPHGSGNLALVINIKVFSDAAFRVLVRDQLIIFA